jgi:hypothetical protein
MLPSRHEAFVIQQRTRLIGPLNMSACTPFQGHQSIIFGILSSGSRVVNGALLDPQTCICQIAVLLEPIVFPSGHAEPSAAAISRAAVW